MANTKKFPPFFFFFVLFSCCFFSTSSSNFAPEIKVQQDKDEPYVGVNIGTDVSNLLSPADLVAFLQLQKITHIRLYDADPDILKALAKTKIRVIISVPNNQILAIGSSNTTAANKGVVPIDNSLFKPLTPSKEMVDPNTLLHYTNVLDAMIDSVYFSMKNLNITDVLVLVTESGWPSKGDSKEPYATIDNADTYNSNLIKHIIDRSGTPLHPEITSSVYIYELFNEDLRSPPLSEANWGLFHGNSTPVYLLHVSGSGTFLANDTTNQTYCIAMDGVDKRTMQAALDWACGPGRANCSEIQPGESCYQPNDVKNHASYAFDSYYQKEGGSPSSCDFKGVAMITTTDPSHGSCIFPGSKKVSNKTSEVVNATQPSGANTIRFLGAQTSIFDKNVHVLFGVALCLFYYSLIQVQLS
uniref:X8 domain-containing protein n=1 Tax=Solanum lycopersicum TaxID=4081 RepID=A0A3Q7F792_SOLLC